MHLSINISSLSFFSKPIATHFPWFFWGSNRFKLQSLPKENLTKTHAGLVIVRQDITIQLPGLRLLKLILCSWPRRGLPLHHRHTALRALGQRGSQRGSAKSEQDRYGHGYGKSGASKDCWRLNFSFHGESKVSLRS